MSQPFTSKTSSDPRATIKEKIIFKKIKFTNLLLPVPQSFFLLLQPVHSGFGLYSQVLFLIP